MIGVGFHHRYVYPLSDIDEDRPQISLSSHKINYEKPLGSGTSATVYDLIPRPDGEQGSWWTWLFPYWHDSHHRPNKNPPTSLCVKVFNVTSLLRDGLAACLIGSEYRSNETAKKYGLSTIKFYTNASLFYQIKTKIEGETFEYHVENNSFELPGRFNMRKAFVSFLQKINHPNLFVFDTHAGNIMYDEIQNRWQIVDGFVSDGILARIVSVCFTVLEKCVLRNRKVDNIHKFLTELFFHGSGLPQKTARILVALIEYARDDQEYTESIDQTLIKT